MRSSAKLPDIFHVNWFRQDKDGKFLWPGFGDNLRVLRWIVDRCAGRVGAQETPIGFLPRAADLDLQGLDIRPEVLDSLLAVDAASWRREMQEISGYFGEFGQQVPAGLIEEYKRVVRALG